MVMENQYQLTITKTITKVTLPLILIIAILNSILLTKILVTTNYTNDSVVYNQQVS